MQEKRKKRVAFLLAALVTVLLIPSPSFATDYGDADTITYSVKAGKALVFEEDDFYDACDDLTGRDLDYVTFSLPASSRGVLYYDYDEDDGDYDSKVTNSKKYYYDSSPYLARVAFVPDKKYDGTVSIDYTGYDVRGNSYDGKVKITVKESSKKTSDTEIEYSVDKNKVLNFDEEDFYDLCEDLNDEDLDYVIFSLPASSKGVLYYDYDEDDGDYDSKVSASKKYYYDSSPYLARVAFVPDKNFTGLCSIDFKGYDIDGYSFSGTVEITVKGDLLTAGTISYTVASGSHVFFKEEDFNAVSRNLKGSSLDYVKFTLPSASVGKLYYGYVSSNNYTSLVNDSTKYYYGATPFLMNVAYVPAGSAGTTSVEYTGYDKEGRVFSGKVQITVSGSTGTVTPPTTTTGAALKKSKYFRDVDEAYSWAVDYIDSLYESGTITGTTVDGTAKEFRPGSKITRGEFMVLLYRALNLQAAASGNFSDVPQGSYYYDAIATAKALGIAQGAENKFNPESSISRQDAMVLAYRTLSKSGKGVVPGDVSILSSYGDSYMVDDYAKESVAALVKAGIITGSDDNKLHAMASITRIQAATIIYRITH